MTPADTAEVLNAIAHFDGRTITPPVVAAWHAVIGEYDRADALRAVLNHQRTSTERMMPAHLVREIVRVRNDRADAKHHEIRQIPSRFEDDPERQQRIAENLERIRHAYRMPRYEPDPNAPEGTIQDIALARSRRERGRNPRPETGPIQRDGKPLDIRRVPGPRWADPGIREMSSRALLHAAGRPCGALDCRGCPEWEPQR